MTVQTRTAGEIELSKGNMEKLNLDLSEDQRFKADDFNRLDLEVEHLDTKVKTVHRFIESLVTGQYNKLNKDIDPNEPPDEELNKEMDADADGIVSS